MLTLLLAHAGTSLHLHDYTAAATLAVAVLTLVAMLPRFAERLAPTTRRGTPNSQR